MNTKTALANPYFAIFGQKQETSLNRTLLGGKGTGLAEMASIGLPVPPGFILTTKSCNEFRRNGNEFFPALLQAIEEGLKKIEKRTGLILGDTNKPLLISVRSGAPVSMPGMMDTLLNLGLNDETVQGFAHLTQNHHLAYDNYRRFIQMFGTIVSKIPVKEFEQAFSLLRMEENVTTDIELSAEGMKKACILFKKIYEEKTSFSFPQDVKEQLKKAVKAVFSSWDSERSVLYRQIHHIPDELGTGVIIQQMVFGNKNQKSATGVAFTRDPATGERKFYGEFLLDAQGEEVVAGKRTPHPLNEYQKKITGSDLPSLESLMPNVYQELLEIVDILENYYKDMQDIEFTIDDGKLFMLQTRTGKRTGFAAVRMAIEMLKENLIDEKTALKRVDPDQLSQLLAPVFDQKIKEKHQKFFVAKGLNAGPGAASGVAAFSSEKAVEWKKQGIDSILIREEANPDDFPGVVASSGILTTRGGSTSHAAVVARGMGKPCVVGCSDLHIHETQKTITSSDHQVIKEGDPISIDGTTGEVFFCSLQTSLSEVNQVLLSKTKSPNDSLIFQQFDTLMQLADRYRTLKIRVNADNGIDCETARAFGAEGVGLCRTEHMFLEPKRLADVRSMLFSTRSEERKEAIRRLLPYQKQDFMEIFEKMDGFAVTIRLLDPPLHEFMPRSSDELAELASFMHIPLDKLLKIRSSLEERNPMLGHRGCRLGIIYPDLTTMQARAIFEAAIETTKKGIKVFPEIMVPLIATEEEFFHQKTVIDLEAKKVFQEKQLEIPYSVGTMIELPRAALLAFDIAKLAEFFSFGTNDLTQTTFGISRDDSAKFVPTYVKGVPHPQSEHDLIHLLIDDPFQVIDQKGVGKLMEWAIQEGKKARDNLKCGICGEHGGQKDSILYFNKIGLDYVSCSPYRVPVARLSAAIANL